MDTALTTEQIAAWLEPALRGCTPENAAVDAADELGSDDWPRLHLTERTYTEAHRRAYGEWGAEREVRWELGRRDEPFSSAAIAMRTAKFVEAFVRRNGRVQLTLRDTVLNGSAMKRLQIDSIADR